MRFKDNVEFKEAIRKYSIVKRCDLKAVKNEPERQKYHCKAIGCKWEILASLDNRDKSFQVKSYYQEHKCYKTRVNTMCIALYLANYFKKRIHKTLFDKCKTMMEDTYNELKLNVKFDKCMRANQIVIKKLEDNLIEEYGNAVGYVRYLESINLGNKVTVVVDRPRTGGTLVF
ncbi:hypothetical protein SLE2022_207540 [Rubroshorea leprosula]